MGKKAHPLLREPKARQSNSLKDLIGAIWILPSYDAVTAMLAHAMRKEKVELHPGSNVRDASFISMSDEQGKYVVVIGLGFAFSAAFLAACERLSQKYGGHMFPAEERERKQELLLKTYEIWQKVKKQEAKERRALNRHG